MKQDYSSFIINQGDQVDDSIIEEKNVLVSIFKLRPVKDKKNQMVVDLRVLQGAHKGREISDFITYDPEDKMSWKYRRLRASANVPYTKGESPRIDIGKLLYNKVIKVNLEKYTKEETGMSYQNVVYLDPATNEDLAPSNETAVDLEDLPQEPIPNLLEDIAENKAVPPKPKAEKETLDTTETDFEDIESDTEW
jgi:hypothetical protein